MKRFIALSLTLIYSMLFLIPSFSEGILPSLNEEFGVDMPSLRKVLLRDPDKEEATDDGTIVLLFSDVSEKQFDDWNIYIKRFGCSLDKYDVDDGLLFATLIKDKRTFSFTYNSGSLELILSYPEGTNEEDVDIYKLRDSYFTIGKVIELGTYEQSDEESKEPIEWIILDRNEEKALLLSKYILEYLPYEKTRKNTTWEKSYIRKWLNSEFLEKAFSFVEQDCILTTDVKNDKSQGLDEYTTSGGADTQDKIFFLSYKEADRLFESRYDREGDLTKVAKNRGNILYAKEGYNGTLATTQFWWLRSPGKEQNIGTAVDIYGMIDAYYQQCQWVDEGCGVRPALWIDINKYIIK